jgi:pyruvate/oxaloacetate carboxyltransferase
MPTFQSTVVSTDLTQWWKRSAGVDLVIISAGSGHANPEHEIRLDCETTAVNYLRLHRHSTSGISALSATRIRASGSDHVGCGFAS